MSDTELRLVERFFNLALEQFANGWHSITSWHSQLTEKNTLRLGNPIQNNQLYQVCRFTIDVCGHQGWFDIALPFAGLDFFCGNSNASQPMWKPTPSCRRGFKPNCAKPQCG